jgi:hypothetical protein
VNDIGHGYIQRPCVWPSNPWRLIGLGPAL